MYEKDRTKTPFMYRPLKWYHHATGVAITLLGGLAVTYVMINAFENFPDNYNRNTKPKTELILILLKGKIYK